jgi:hypothetical protein
MIIIVRRMSLVPRIRHIKRPLLQKYIDLARRRIFMNTLTRKAGTLLAVACFMAQVPLAALAETTLQGGATRSKYKAQTFGQAHPKVKSTLVGAGVGTAAGAGVGLLTGKGIARGAVIGAGTGAGAGLITSSKTLKRHPVMKNAALGTTVGLGLGWAATRGHNSGKKTAAAAAIGGAVGAGLGWLKNK